MGKSTKLFVDQWNELDGRLVIAASEAVQKRSDVPGRVPHCDLPGPSYAQSKVMELYPCLRPKPNDFCGLCSAVAQIPMPPSDQQAIVIMLEEMLKN